MPRLSVSLEEEQASWIAQRADEYGVSKGKVVREAIDQIRTGDSNFTTPVKSGEVISDRLESMESRLRTLEESIDSRQESAMEMGTRNTIAAQSDSLSEAPPDDEGDHPTEESIQAADSPDQVSSDSHERESDDHGVSTNRDSTSTHDRADSQTAGIETGTEDISVEESRTLDDDTGTLDSSENEFDQLSPNEHLDDTPRVESADDSDTNGGPKVDIEKAAPSIRTYLTSEVENEGQADAVTSCWELLEKRGTVHVRALKQQYEEYPLGRDSAEVWWTEDIKPHLDRLPGVILPEGNGSFYRFKY